MRAARVDSNHGQVVRALRGIGASVQSLAEVGDGCPDLLVGYLGVNSVLEVKDGTKPESARKLTPAQVRWHLAWKGKAFVVTSPEEAIRVVRRAAGLDDDPQDLAAFKVGKTAKLCVHCGKRREGGHERDGSDKCWCDDSGE